jgi:hypothetical protein
LHKLGHSAAEEVVTARKATLGKLILVHWHEEEAHELASELQTAGCTRFRVLSNRVIVGRRCTKVGPNLLEPLPAVEYDRRDANPQSLYIRLGGPSEMSLFNAQTIPPFQSGESAIRSSFCVRRLKTEMNPIAEVYGNGSRNIGTIRITRLDHSREGARQPGIPILYARRPCHPDQRFFRPNSLSDPNN